MTRKPRLGRAAPRGLTLIEVLVVLAIFGIGWFAILPNLNLLDRVKPDNSALDQVNAFMGEVRSQARNKGRIQRLVLVPGKKVMVWNATVYTLPSTVSRCLVNGRQYFDRPTEFRVYPAGSMDDVRITLDGGTVLSANVLNGEFVPTP